MAIKAGEAFVEIVADDRKLRAGLQKAQARLQSFGRAAQQIGLKLAAVGTALAVPFALGAKEFVNFESSLSRIDVLLNKNTKSIGEFKKEVEDLSVKFGIEKSILVGGLEDILQASIPAANATDVLVTAIKASQIGFTDVRTAADALTTIINSYGLSADRAGQISDELFTIVRRGKTSFENLANNIGNVASVAAAAGISVEEMGASISLLTRKGTRTEIAITSLRAALVTFLNPQKEAAKLAKQYGLELSQSALANEGLFKSLKKIAGLPADTIAKIFPNVRALKAVLAITNDIDEFGADIDALKTSGGTVDEQFKKIEKTLSFMFRVINQKGKRALAIIGEALAEDMRRVGRQVQIFAGVLGVLLKQNAKLIPTFAKIAIGIAAVGFALIGIGSAALIGALGIGVLSGAITALVAVVGLVLSPIGVLGLVIIQLSVLIAKEFKLVDRSTKSLGKTFRDLKVSFKDSFDPIVRAVSSGNLEGAFKLLGAAITVAWIKFTNKISQIWNSLSVDIDSVTDNMATMILSSFSSAFQSVQEVFLNFKKVFLNTFAEVIGIVQKLFIEIGRRADIFGAKLTEALSPEQESGVADKVIRDNNAQAKKDSQKIDDRTNNTIAENTTAVDKELRSIKKAGKARRDALKEANRQTQSEIFKRRNKDLVSSQNELRDAQKELSELKRSVDVETRKREKEFKAADTGVPRDPFKELKKSFKNLKVPQPSQVVSEKLSIRGSFSGVGIERGANAMLDIQTKILDKAQDQLDELRKIKTNTADFSGVGVLQ